MWLGITSTEESAERAVLVALYPKPALNRVARKSIPFSKFFRLAVLFPAVEVSLVLFAGTRAPGRHYDVCCSRGDVMVVQLFPDKRQTRRERRLCRGWIWSGKVGRCSRDRPGGSTMLLRIAIFPTIGNQACWPVGKNTYACGFVLLYYAGKA